MKFFWTFLILLLLLFLQTSFFSIPFVLGGILFFCVLYREYWIFPVAFLMGIFLDVLTFHTVGSTSMFFTIILGGVFLYERKFEIQSIPFITAFSFITTILYGIIFQTTSIFWQAVIVALCTGGVFFLLSMGNIGHPSRISQSSF